MDERLCSKDQFMFLTHHSAIKFIFKSSQAPVLCFIIIIIYIIVIIFVTCKRDLVMTLCASGHLLPLNVVVVPS